MAGVELAKAYVQIVPSAKGIKGSIEQAMGGEADKAGTKLGTSLGSKIKSALITAGIGKTLQSIISEGANLEQAIGGIETLFKDNASQVIKYSKMAYKTAGISANSYMEQVTSFSASLLQSLDGNTKKASESANQAIIDMADNSNKMGTSLDMIQNAYQGFAKQNYTMLDNLKLGYGGTKGEMERLLAEAEKLPSALGRKFDITNLADVYTAIHLIQEDLGITGTTAKEASTTVTGSLNAMKSSLSNLMGAMALGESIKAPLQALVDTTGTFLLKNFIPMVGNILKSVPQIIKELGPQLLDKGSSMLLSLSKGFKNGFPKLSSKVLDLAQNLGDWLSKQMPVLIEKGFEMLSNLVDGIIKALPEMIRKLPKIISTFANIINNNFPTILKKGAGLLLELIKGIISCIPTLIQNIPQIIRAIVDTLMAFQWLNLGKNIINGLLTGIKSMFSGVSQHAKWLLQYIVQEIKYLPQNLMYLGKQAILNFGKSITNSTGTVSGAIKGVCNVVVNSIKGLPSKMISIGKNLIKGLWNGISNMTGWITAKLDRFSDSVLNGIKKFFGIHSPSKVFEKEVGEMLPLGMAEGIENNMKYVDDAIEKMNREAMSVVNANANLSTSYEYDKEQDNRLTIIIELLKLLLNKGDGDIVINLNNREVARALKEMGVVIA